MKANDVIVLDDLKEYVVVSKVNHNGSDYINVARLVNRAGTGILQQIEPIEDEIFRHVQPILEAIRKNGKAGKETTEFYQWVDQYVREQYQARFHISL